MDDDSASHGGRLGGILVAVLMVGTLLIALGWYWMTNRKGLALNTSGFDVHSVAQETPAVSYTTPAQVHEGMMIQSDKSIQFGDGPSAAAPGRSGPAPGLDAQAGFAADTRKYEGLVRDFAIKMTRRYPSVRQYGRDWMSYADLRKLNDNYTRNHDPMAFMAGLSRSPNFGKLISKYSTDPGIRAFVVEGVRQAPGELLSTAGDALRSDATVKNLVANVAQALGLPPSMTTVINGGQVDQSKIMSDLTNNPQLRGSIQSQAAPPVVLSNQQ